MLQNGNVGIGTTTPTASLTVNGNVVASGTIAATNGFGSYATNNYTMNATGFTNVETRNIQIFELTGTSILYSNSASTMHFSLGSPTGTGVTLILKPGCSVSGTGCVVAGMEDF
jgi:predicted choloylglycine hydrolase